MSLSQQVADFFSVDGKLCQAVDGFSVRQAQVDMAQSVVEAINNEQTLIAEAGTGTGKTFAYLIPALLSGKKILISTATKTLQQQLIEKDLPGLLKLCKVKGQARLLKGRENYLCQERLSLAESLNQSSKHDWKKLSLIREWSKITKTGDLVECSGIEENDPILRKVCARLEFCQTAGCAKDSDCFYPEAKQKAQDAQVLVVNHHLFCADLALRERGFGELLPDADVYIFDEAHQLPDIAAQFLGISISRYQLEELARDIKQAKVAESPESEDLIQRVNGFLDQLKTVNEALGKWDKRWSWEQLEANVAFIKTVKQLSNHLETLKDHLDTLKDRGKQIASVCKRTEDFTKQLDVWLNTDVETEVRWAESSQTRFKLNLTPLTITDAFKRQRDSIGGSWIFTSATLSVRDKFDYFQQRLGLPDAVTGVWPSPFDFLKQGVIYHPLGLPEPRDSDYIKICLRAIWPLLKASEGRAFLLFTSFRALLEAKEILQKHWQGTLLVQGEAGKNELLERFVAQDRAILLGTSSFWEGVDVRGQALQLVMIDRIPFIPPDDPLVQARESYLKQKGLSGFAHFQLPEAIMALKQGSGRLIRDQEDTGVLVLCDPRLLTKRYGKGIVESLPNFPWVYQPDEAIKILQQGLNDGKSSID